jgi:hypothetical protein
MVTVEVDVGLLIGSVNVVFVMNRMINYGLSFLVLLDLRPRVSIATGS